MLILPTMKESRPKPSKVPEGCHPKSLLKQYLAIAEVNGANIYPHLSEDFGMRTCTGILSFFLATTTRIMKHLSNTSEHLLEHWAYNVVLLLCFVSK